MHYLQGEVMLRFIQNEDEQRKILQACHVNATAGHKSHTIFRIRERFMRHGMVKDVKELLQYVVYLYSLMWCTSLAA